MPISTHTDPRRPLIINKIDLADIDLEMLMADIGEAFGSQCLPINLPCDGGRSVADCFFSPATGTQTDFSSVGDAHTRILDQVIELDDELMEMYLEQGEDLAPERLHDAFESALREGHLIPVCFVSALSGTGVKELLDIIARVMPNPLEGNPPLFVNGSSSDAQPILLQPSTDKHVIAHVFKLSIDAFVGKLGFFRIHQGTVTKDSQLLISEERKPFRIGHLYAARGKDLLEIDRGIPGDICVVSKIDDIVYDAVLHDSHEDDQIHLRPMDLPAPMFGLAIEAKTRGDEQKLSDGLHKLAAEDPCFLVEHNAVLNETIIRGLGELHLRIELEKLKDRHHVEVESRTPRIVYKETISKPAEGHHRHKKQTGGAGQFGEVYLHIEPTHRGTGFEFIDKVVGGVIPHQYIPAVEKGVRQVLDEGAIAGYPLQDVRVTVYDGKHHPVDSKEVAFVAAGKKAFLEAIGQAEPIILEPIVDIEVTAPQESMGDITGNLSAKRGRISGTIALSGGLMLISGKVPLSELSSYQSELKSVTGGAGSYSMELSHHDPVPAPIQQQLMAEYKPKRDDD